VILSNKEEKKGMTFEISYSLKASPLMNPSDT